MQDSLAKKGIPLITYAGFPRKKVDSPHYICRIPSQKSGFPSLHMQDSLAKKWIAFITYAGFPCKKVDCLHYICRIPSQKRGFPLLHMQDSLAKKRIPFITYAGFPRRKVDCLIRYAGFLRKKVDCIHYICRILSQESGFPSLHMQDSLAKKVDSLYYICRIPSQKGGFHRKKRIPYITYAGFPRKKRIPCITYAGCQTLTKGFGITEMYRIVRHLYDPRLPSYSYGNYRPVKIRHYCNGKSKWIYLHKDDLSVRSLLENTFQYEYCQCFTFKRCDNFKLKCTSHGCMYSAHYFGKISITSKQWIFATQIFDRFLG